MLSGGGWRPNMKYVEASCHTLSCPGSKRWQPDILYKAVVFQMSYFLSRASTVNVIWLVLFVPLVWASLLLILGAFSMKPVAPSPRSLMVDPSLLLPDDIMTGYGFQGCWCGMCAKAHAFWFLSGKTLFWYAVSWTFTNTAIMLNEIGILMHRMLRNQRTIAVHHSSRWEQ